MHAAQRIGVELPAADRIATALNAWRQNATTSDKAKAGQLQRLVGQRNDLTASSDLRRIFFAPPVNTVQAVLVSSSHSEIPNDRFSGISPLVLSFNPHADRGSGCGDDSISKLDEYLT